ncbi:MAG: MinD/ParA family ATP-binding protein [Candidatus Micrarchaeia archaeon]
MQDPYIIRVASQKGGVGKTTISVNLSCALQSNGYRTLLIDADTTNPSVGFHVGLEKSNIGYKQLLYKKAKLRDVISVHAPTGLHVVTGTINSKPFVATEQEIKPLISELKKTNYNFIIVDTQPGYYALGITKYVDESLLVTTPDMPSIASIIRVATLLDGQKGRHSLVINRIRNRKYEVNKREIEEMYEGRVVGTLPEDDIVPISIEEHIPAYVMDYRNRFSRAVQQLSKFYGSGSESYKESGSSGSSKSGFWRRILHRF